MYRLLIVLLLLFAACVPVDVQPGKQEPTIEPTPAGKYLNYNPGLLLGECNRRMFTTEQWGPEVITQCAPDGYELYEDNGDSSPIRAVYTGQEYSILPHGSTDAIGLVMPLKL